MVKRDQCGGFWIDWRLPILGLVGMGAMCLFWLASYSKDVEANTKFREMAAPKLERMSTVLDRVDHNVTKLMDGRQ